MDVVLGTESEIKAVMLEQAGQMQVVDSQVSSVDVAGDLDAAIQAILDYGPQVLVVKRGQRGAQVFARGQDPLVVPGFPVEVFDTLGAGDAFAGGLIYGYLKIYQTMRQKWLCQVHSGHGSPARCSPQIARHGYPAILPYVGAFPNDGQRCLF